MVKITTKNIKRALRHKKGLTKLPHCSEVALRYY